MSASHVRWEVWISNQFLAPIPEASWRFNACFDGKLRAEAEAQWYITRGYATDIRVRTSRFQRNEHITTS